MDPDTDVTEQDQGTDDEAAFDAAWAEDAESDPGATPESHAGAADDALDDDEKAKGGDDDADDGQKTGDGKRDSQPDDDPWKGLSDEQRSRIQELEHTAATAAGQKEQAARRYRENERLKAENAELRRKAEQSAGGKPADKKGAQDGADKQGTDDEGADKEQDGEAANAAADEAIKTLEEEYPEVGKPVRAIIAPLQQTIQALKETNERLTERVQVHDRNLSDAQVDRQLAVLEKDHPDWRDVIQSDEDAFLAWVDAQPKGVQQMARQNSARVQDAAEAGLVVSLYKSHLAAAGKLPAPKAEDADADTGADTGATEKQPGLSSKRQQQLSAAHGATSRGPGAAKTTALDDYDAAWEAEKADEQRRAS